MPEEGAELWPDSLMIPDLARHRTDAESLVDYYHHYYRPEAAAEVAPGATTSARPCGRAVLADSDDADTAAFADHPLILPDTSMRRRLVIARDITSGERAGSAKRWNAIVGL